MSYSLASSLEDVALGVLTEWSVSESRGGVVRPGVRRAALRRMFLASPPRQGALR